MGRGLQPLFWGVCEWCVLGICQCSRLRSRRGMAGGKERRAERLIPILPAGIIPTQGCPCSYPSGAGCVGRGQHRLGGQGVVLPSPLHPHPAGSESFSHPFGPAGCGGGWRAPVCRTL